MSVSLHWKRVRNGRHKTKLTSGESVIIQQNTDRWWDVNFVRSVEDVERRPKAFKFLRDAKAYVEDLDQPSMEQLIAANKAMDAYVNTLLIRAEYGEDAPKYCPFERNPLVAKHHVDCPARLWKRTANLERARNHIMTSEQVEAQRRSFAYGNAHIHNSHITRELITQIAERQKLDGQE